VTVSGDLSISAVHPISGSVHGGQTITLTGNGFNSNTSVTIGSTVCQVVSFSVNELVCVIHACNSMMIDQPFPLYVNFDGQVRSTGLIANFTCDSRITPIVSSIFPLSGRALQNLNISGKSFGNDSNLIHVS